ncbi:MAG: hypothetical protein BWX74_00696 [Tenericutes bacterium ADurb.Bin087]|nr:MAG: hypothetical protein BWX74_00696 [Tenericutes bacterium ADurb.Bin087]
MFKHKSNIILILLLCMSFLVSCKNKEKFEFLLTVDNDTKQKGQDFIINISLKNRCRKTITLPFYNRGITPFIFNIKNFVFPDPDMLVDYPERPNFPSVTLKNTESYEETWRLGSFGYKVKETDEWTELPLGEHELYITTTIKISEDELFEFKSNVVKLIVV